MVWLRVNGFAKGNATPNSAPKPRPFAAFKNNLHTASFVTEKGMCTYTQMMKGSIERGLRFLGLAQRSDGASPLLSFDSQ